MLATDFLEGSQVRFLTFVGSVVFYCQEMWATDLREVSLVGFLTFVGIVVFYCPEMGDVDRLLILRRANCGS